MDEVVIGRGATTAAFFWAASTNPSLEPGLLLESDRLVAEVFLREINIYRNEFGVYNGDAYCEAEVLRSPTHQSSAIDRSRRLFPS